MEEIAGNLQLQLLSIFKYLTSFIIFRLKKSGREDNIKRCTQSMETHRRLNKYIFILQRMLLIKIKWIQFPFLLPIINHPCGSLLWIIKMYEQSDICHIYPVEEIKFEFCNFRLKSHPLHRNSYINTFST